MRREVSDECLVSGRNEAAVAGDSSEKTQSGIMDGLAGKIPKRPDYNDQQGIKAAFDSLDALFWKSLKNPKPGHPLQWGGGK
jgi:hypothetical protein